MNSISKNLLICVIWLIFFTYAIHSEKENAPNEQIQAPEFKQMCKLTLSTILN